MLLHDGTTFSWGWSETTAMSKGNFFSLISLFPLFSPFTPPPPRFSPKGLWMSTLCGESRAPDKIREEEQSCGRTIDDGDHAVKRTAAEDSNKDLRYASTYVPLSLTDLAM